MSLGAVYVPCFHFFMGCPSTCLVPLQAKPENELEEVVADGQEVAKAPDVPTLKALGLPQPDFHSLILDLGALSFVDTVCIKSLKNVRG